MEPPRTAPVQKKRPYRKRPKRDRADGRTIASRRFSDLIQEFSAELGGGTLSASDAGLVRQAATLSLRLEQIQVEIVKGAPPASDDLIRLASEHRRLLTSLRTRAAKDKPAGHDPLAAHIAAKYGKTSTDPDVENAATAP